MNTFGKLAFAVLVGVLPAVASAQDSGQIRVTGTGTVSAAPDMAVITVGVAEQDKDAAKAMETVSGKVAVIIERLVEAGVVRSDIQTQSISVNALSQRYDNGAAPKITGFEASNTVAVQVRVLDTLGFVIDRVLDAGANRMYGLRFAIADDAMLMDQARAAAVQDATAKAQLYAQAAGVALGPLLELTEGGAGAAPQVTFRAAALSDGVPIAEGEVAQSASVTLVYGIAPLMVEETVPE